MHDGGAPAVLGVAAGGGVGAGVDGQGRLQVAHARHGRLLELRRIHRNARRRQDVHLPLKLQVKWGTSVQILIGQTLARRTLRLMKGGRSSRVKCARACQGI